MSKRERFEMWIQDQNISPTTVNNYLRSIRYMQERFKHLTTDGNVLDIYEIDSIEQLTSFLSDDVFIEQDRKHHRVYSSALKKYIEFLTEESMAYSSEVGNVNIDILFEQLGVIRKGAEVVFQNNDVFLISPSIQNGSNWFDIRKWNLERYKESGKKGFLILRHNQHFLIADLEDFSHQLMKQSYLKFTSTGGEHWKFNIVTLDNTYTVYNQSNRSILYIMKYADRETLKKEIEKMMKVMPSYQRIEKANLTNGLIESDISISKLVIHIHTYLISKGFLYAIQNIKNVYLSLRSKPFVIISGISGTGKTNIVQLFAESIGATEANGRFKLIPVRPDWSDGSELLGYVDLKGDFKKGPLTEVIENAYGQPDLPHFVLLDEMNLARVEYYFSDVLSVMESRKREGDVITSSVLVEEKYIGKALRLPNNLYIIGTVNMDETTHPFSKKVLDRANTLEFNEIHLENFDFLLCRELVEPIVVSNSLLEPCYLNVKDVYGAHEELVKWVSKELATINQYLQYVKAEVGYRVRDEVCFYMSWNEQNGVHLLERNEAFDFCLMQKVLPRILGSGQHVENALQGLFMYLTKVEYDKGIDVQGLETVYPKSTRKVVNMLEAFYDVGFTSFWTA